MSKLTKQEIALRATLAGKSEADIERAVEINKEISSKWVRIAIESYSGYRIPHTIEEVRADRNKLFATAKLTGWTELHSFLIPELTNIIRGV